MEAVIAAFIAAAASIASPAYNSSFGSQRKKNHRKPPNGLLYIE